MPDLINRLSEQFREADELLHRQVQELAERLRTVTAEEAQALYRVVTERPDLPEVPDSVIYLAEPLILFGPEYVAETIEGVRAGTCEVPFEPDTRIEPLPEYLDDPDWDYCDDV